MPAIVYKNEKGKKLSGTTTIINNIGWNKEPLKWWAWKCGKENIDIRSVTEKAQDAGSLGHYLVHCKIKGITEEAPYVDTFEAKVRKHGYKALSNFEKWAEMVSFFPLYSEINLVSEKYQYGGTPDCIARINKELALFDWKTSNAIYVEYLIQMYAYKVLWEENFPNEPLSGGVHLVRFTKESASFHHHHWAWNDLFEAGAWDDFQAALTLHNGKKRLEKLL